MHQLNTPQMPVVACARAQATTAVILKRTLILARELQDTKVVLPQLPQCELLGRFCPI